MFKVITAIIIESNKILMAKKETGIWTFPGGIMESGESELECLSREVAEELSETQIKNPIFYHSQKGISPTHKLPIEVRTYLAEISGKLGLPSNEIIDRKYFDVSEQIKCSPISYDIIQNLVRDGYLK